MPTITQHIEKSRIAELNNEAWLLRVSDSNRSFALSSDAVQRSRACGDQQGLANSLRALAFAHIRLSRHEEASVLLDEAEALFRKSGDENGLSDVLEYRGIICRSKGDFHTSLRCLFQSLELRQRNQYHEGVSLAFYHLGVTYRYLGNFPQALTYLLQSLEKACLGHFWIPESYALNLIGQIYFESGDWHEALHYFERSLAIRKSSGDRWGEAGCLDNIGLIFFKKAAHRQAADYCGQSLEICRSIGDKKGEANTLLHLSQIMLSAGDGTVAQARAAESLAIRRQIGDRKGQAEVLLLLAQVERSAGGRLENSLTLLEEARSLADEIGARDLLVNIHEAFYLQHKSAGQFAEALHWMESYRSLEKDLHTEALGEQLRHLEMGLRAEAAEKEANGLRRKTEELAALNEKIKKEKKRAEKQRVQAEAALQELRKTQAQLIQSERLASLGELTAGIAHEIQNPLNFVNNFSEVSIELLDDLKAALQSWPGNCDWQDCDAVVKDLTANLQKIFDHGQRASSIVKNMLQHARSGTGTAQATNVRLLTEEYLNLTYHGFRAKSKEFAATVQTHFDENIEPVLVVPEDLGRVLLNLCNNAFYAVYAKWKKEGPTYMPTVTVSIRQRAGTIEMSVADNGTGIPQDVATKIFQPFFTTKPAGEGTGLGLSLSYDLVTKSLGGRLTVTSTEGIGTCFTIHLPQNKA